MRTQLAVILLAVVAFTAGAIGNPEAGDYTPVAGLENWDATVDLKDYKAGKYNLIVRGVDEAGNVSFAGPYNVFVDPASDLPVVHVSHPAAGSRVSTLLHVVGTCVDDDGVKSVQVRLDDRDAAVADGGEFWAWEMSAEGLTEGVHTLTVHGVDVNGVEGPAQVIRFNVDKKPPTTRIISHPNGSIVTGRVSLEGEVADPNGVASLSASADGGKVFTPLKLDLDKPGQKGTFRYDLDTRDIEDGALILSFKSVDRTGSTGRTAFLVFVNNQAPALEVLAPAADATVNGKVIVTGRAVDRIGVKSLSWELGGATGHGRPHAGEPVLDARARPHGPEVRNRAGLLHPGEPHGQPSDHAPEAEGRSRGGPPHPDGRLPREGRTRHPTRVPHRARRRRRRRRPGRVHPGRCRAAAPRGVRGVLDPASRSRTGHAQGRAEAGRRERRHRHPRGGRVHRGGGRPRDPRGHHRAGCGLRGLRAGRRLRRGQGRKALRHDRLRGRHPAGRIRPRRRGEPVSRAAQGRLRHRAPLRRRPSRRAPRRAGSTSR